MPNKFWSLGIWTLIIVCNLLIGHWNLNSYAQDKKDEPIIINGDTVEYLTEGKEVSATGNVSVISKGSKLTCQKLTVNTQTKEGEAEGNVRLEDAKGIIVGEKIKYNFQTKTGMIIDAGFRETPFFGRAENVEKISDSEFVGRRGYMTTCDFDNPHWRIKSKRMDIFPDDKVQTKDDTVYIGRVPVLYAPQFNKSLQDPLMQVQLMPGKRKDWGPYMLSAWGYNITEDVKSRIYLDYRSNFGIAEGFGTNYSTSEFGKGDFKYYYTQERDKSKDVDQNDVNVAKVFQRYFVRWRHQADIDAQTKFTGEYYNIVDSKRAIYGGSNFNFLKDYFFREYEEQAQPPSYLLFHHSFGYSSVDLFAQKRVNRWYDPGYLEKLPEVNYSLPSIQMGDASIYFSNTSSLGNYNIKNTSTSTPAANNTSPGTTDAHVNRLDTSNRISLPMKVAFISFDPFVMSRQTFYDKTAANATLSARTIFYSGADMSTKFYRIFNVNSNLLGLNLNGLRHIITPTVGYAFNKEPTILSRNLRQMDGVDSITRNNSSTVGLSNKLQTKRSNQSVDLLDFLITSNYAFKPKTGAKRGSSFSDFLFQLKLLPYSWMRIDSDATYTHSVPRDTVSYNRFSNANYSLTFDIGKGRSFSLGQRYQLKGGNEMTYNLQWPLNPKWAFSIYQRRLRGHGPSLNRGLKEQEYTVSRDLHCWIMEMAYNGTKGKGSTIWFTFRIKAFPEMEFNLNQSYHAPKTGAFRNQ